MYTSVILWNILNFKSFTCFNYSYYGCGNINSVPMGPWRVRKTFRILWKSLRSRDACQLHTTMRSIFPNKIYFLCSRISVQARWAICIILLFSNAHWILYFFLTMEQNFVCLKRKEKERISVFFWTVFKHQKALILEWREYNNLGMWP
jgi:hypothetical protein